MTSCQVFRARFDTGNFYQVNAGEGANRLTDFAGFDGERRFGERFGHGTVDRNVAYVATLVVAGSGGVFCGGVFKSELAGFDFFA